MVKKQIIITLFLFFNIALNLFATHYMGGEITWECLSNGRYRFTMKLYRECATSVTYYNTETLYVANHPSLTSITMNLYPGGNPLDGLDGALDGKTDISPKCWNPAQQIKCYPQPAQSNMGAIEEWYYTSDAAYPNGVLLSGVPPAQGWIFYHRDCCRNPSTNMVNPTNCYWYLRAIMYPYQGQNTFPCFDNSPVFAEIPSTVICTGYPFKYNHNATDKELDSLAFEWAPAMQNVSVPMGYTAGYSYNSPLPGPAQNPNNVAATMNPYNGEISYTSYTSGAFVTVTKVAAYRCGIKIAEIFREMQIVLLACPGNNQPPSIPGPFYNPVTGLYEYTDTVYAGDVVDFDITIVDYGTLPNGNPQTVTLEASGQDFGAGYTSQTTGCVRPPCATLNPPPVINSLFYLTTHFHWQTSCDHLTHPVSITGIPGICGTLFNVHNFVLKAYDNFCPAPGIKIATITIVVLPLNVLDPPKLKCTQVHSNGDITLNWIPPIDTLHTFNSYHVYFSTSPAGPFVLIDSIFNYNQTSKTYSGLGGNNGPRYFYMKTRSGCYGKYYSEPSDTLSTIYLDVQAVGTGEIANLTWNPVHNPLLSTSSSIYEVYREYPTGTWNLLGNTTSLNYQDTINICSAFVNYRIEIADLTGCKSISSVDGAQLQDGFPPEMPVLDSVTVDLTNGKAKLGWTASNSADVVKYYIYHVIGGPWFLIDSVNAPVTTYTDMTSSPQDAPESYSIAAVDSCKKLSPMSLEHKTIFLSEPVMNACADKVRLEWTNYINFNPSIAGYRIKVSQNGSPYSTLATVNATTTYYEHTGLVNNAEYCYYIQAFTQNNLKTSSSNKRCVVVTKPNQPEYVYLRYATVKNDNYVKLGFNVDTTAYVTRYKILRSEDGVLFDTIAELPANNIFSDVSFNDVHAKVHEKSYYYKVIVSDSCFQDVLVSNVGRTIYLEGSAPDYLSNYINWNKYEDRVPTSYLVYREVENFEPFVKIQSLPSAINSFTDDVENYTESGGRFIYYIEAPLYNVYDTDKIFYDTVCSNKVIILQPPRLYVPNAFAPDGMNNIFKPIGVFTDKDNYLFMIYDRWGQKIFETTDYEKGWDGKFQGNKCPFGVYTYYVKITTSSNKTFIKRGIVTLIR